MENNCNMNEIAKALKKQGESMEKWLEYQARCLTELSKAVKAMNSNLEVFLNTGVYKKQDSTMIEEDSFGTVKEMNSDLLQLYIEFPRFNGEDPEGWISKANNFFKSNPMTDVSKLNLAGHYMSGPAYMWFAEFMSLKTNNWKSLCDWLMDRSKSRLSILKYRGNLGNYSKLPTITIAFVAGCTHSFLNLSTAKNLGCGIREMKPPGVANFKIGDGFAINKKCSKFCWYIGFHKFVADDLLIMPLVGCDVILGADFIRKEKITLSRDGVEILDGKRIIMLKDEIQSTAADSEVAECYPVSVSFPSMHK